MNDATKEKIAILDNCEVTAFHKFMREGMPIEQSLDYYDRIIIPGWVWTEICDSQYRKQYVVELQEKGYPIEILYEKDYIQIVEKELTLLEIFEEVITPYAELRGNYFRHILKGRPKEDIDYFYPEWIEIIYDNWPGPDKKIVNSEGQERMKKHNAGEISIVFLVSLLAYSRDAEITIFTHDADCKCYIQSMRKSNKVGEKLRVSYNNSDIILKEFLKRNILDIASIENLTDKIHKFRTMTCIYRKNDGTNELKEVKVDVASFKEIVSDDSIDIIW